MQRKRSNPVNPPFSLLYKENLKNILEVSLVINDF